jgi:two-component system response regulator AtoC
MATQLDRRGRLMEPPDSLPANSAARLLLVDDDEAACRMLAEVLERESYEVVQAHSVAEGQEQLSRIGFQAVLTDLRMPGASGLDLLRHVREEYPDTLVLVLTAFGDAAAAGEAIRAGAYDFISKPYELPTIRATLARALERRKMATLSREATDTIDVTATTEPQEGVLVGNSPAIIEVMKTVARAAPTNATVLIQGETGTGKELVARTIHRYSERSDRRFLAVNCSALAEGLLESELFGHVRGAFTGAANARPGMFREADRGTLFLDEIGDISPALQARLLRALQEHEIVPVGSESPIKVNVRIIAATNRDLATLVREGKFREDLYYRLNVLLLTLPPLRERRQDIPLLINHFLRTLVARHDRHLVAIDPEAQAMLLGYNWPGNIRELQNVLERAIVLAAEEVIGPEHLPHEVRHLPMAESVTETATGSGPERLLSLEEIERLHVLRVLAHTKGNREEASRILGVSRRTLSRMIQRWSAPNQIS